MENYENEELEKTFERVYDSLERIRSIQKKKFRLLREMASDICEIEKEDFLNGGDSE